ncbi:MAG: hypothetical protein JW999_08065 [Methanotrichaceae archaeon]|nr:hypothetical protein [Methanotrichaceae archaeon]
MKKLSEKDIKIIKKMAPEVEAKSRIEYRFILPPVSVHFAEDAEDFQARLKRLDGRDLGYLAGRILDGSECLLCISPEFAGVFIDMLEEKLPGEDAEKIRALYKSSTGYEA